MVQNLHIGPALPGVQHTAGLAHPHTVAVAVGGNGKNAAVHVIADIEGMAAQSQDALPYLPPRGGGIAYPYGCLLYTSPSPRD